MTLWLLIAGVIALGPMAAGIAEGKAHGLVGAIAGFAIGLVIGPLVCGLALFFFRRLGLRLIALEKNRPKLANTLFLFYMRCSLPGLSFPWELPWP